MKTALIAAGLSVALFGCDLEQPRKDYGSSTVKVIVGDRGHGSGVYIGSGLVVTAAHVVANLKDNKITIKTESGNLLKEAELLWVNTARDIAVIKPKGTIGLKAAKLNCGTPALGDNIMARGNPGPMEFFTSWGHVSGPMRENGKWLESVSTDMTIVMGMSGGPVFNDAGEVAGIVVGALTAPMGFGVSLTGVGLIVPGSTICQLLGRG
jgi:S1-C subfamily serine protease